MSKSYTDTLIIGAGLTGLTTAFYLKKLNQNFLVLEKASYAGGVIKSEHENGFLFEHGPNTGIVGNAAVVELFDDLAPYCQPELAGNDVKKRYILKNSQWHHLPMGLVDAVKTPLFTFNDKFRILGEPFRPAGNEPHESLAAFVKRRMGKSFLDYAIDPFILGVYAGDPGYIVPKYALPKLYNLEQKYGSLIGGTIRKKFDTKTELEKRVSRKVFSFKNGLSAFIEGLKQNAGSKNFIFNATQISIKKAPEGFLTTYTDNSGTVYQLVSKNVVSTAGAYELPGLLPFLDTNELNKITNLLYTRVIEVSLGFKHWYGMKLDGFGGLIPSVEKRDILGILFMSSLFKNRVPEGGALLSVFIGGARRQDLIEKTDTEIEAIIQRECSELLGLAEFKPDLFKIARHHHAIPQYGPDSGIRYETIAKLEKENPGLFIAGNLKGGIGMADRIQQAKTLAEKL